jgi:hypothetical protein
MNTSHYFCYCGAGNFVDLLPFNGSLVHTSENRVRGKRHLQCHSCHFYTFKQMTCAMVFPLSFVHRILYSGRENDRGNTLLAPSVFTDHEKEITPNRPPAGMAGHWSSCPGCSVSVSCPSLLPAVSLFSAHVGWPDRQVGLPAYAVARSRKYTLKVWKRKKFAQLSLYVSRRHSESGDVEVHLQPFLTLVLALDEWSALRFGCIPRVDS